MSQDNLKGFRSYSKARTATPPPSGMPSWAPLMAVAIIAALLGAGFSYTAFNTDGSNDGTTDDDIVLNDDNSDDDLYEPPVDNTETDETEPTVALVTPTDGSSGNAPTLWWYGDADGEIKYTLRYTLAGEEAVEVEQLTTTSYAPELIPGTYTWQVEISDGTTIATSETWSFTVEEPTDAPPVVELLYPGDGESLLEVTLVWSGHDPGGVAVVYDVYLDESDATALVATTVDNRHNPEGLELDTTYFWRVVASDGSLTAESPVWTFTIQPLPEASIIDEGTSEAAEAAIGSMPQVAPGEPLDREAQMTAAQQDAGDGYTEIMEGEGVDMEVVDKDPPTLPEEELNLEPDINLEQADLSEPRHGLDEAWNAQDMAGNLESSIASFPTDDTVDLDRDYSDDFGDFFPSAEEDEGRGGNLFTVTVLTNGNVYDNNSDGNPEYVRLVSLGYGALGNDSAPEYETFYYSEIIIVDVNSDGNPGLVSLSEFGFESYDGDHDGNPEYSSVHVRSAHAWDNNSDGNPEHVVAFSIDYVSVDGDSNNMSEYEAGAFAALELWDNNSDGDAEHFTAAEWAFQMVDSDGDSNSEFMASRVASMELWDNNSDSNPESATVVEWGYATADEDDDGSAELEIVVFGILTVSDQNSTGNPSTIEGYEIFYLHATGEGNYTLASQSGLTYDDSNNDGYPEFVEANEWTYVGSDEDQDGNSEFEAIEFESYLVYDNFSTGKPTFVKAVTHKAWSWDGDDDGEADVYRIIIEVYVRKDSDGDGIPEEEYYVRWDSDDQ